MKQILFVKKYTILAICFVLLITTLTACQKKAPQFTIETYPKIDGSTVTIPLSEAVAATLTQSTMEAIRPYILHNKTHQAYLNLIDKSVDLIFVTGPSEEERSLAEASGVEFEVVPIVSEAFVFLTHIDNPVKGLTAQNIQDIYTGKVTNWLEVGGIDEAIIPYQRPINSGSQTGFLDLVMKGLTPMKAPEELVTAEMGQLIDAVANYENSAAALGYSYYYFVADMWGNDAVKLLEVDGIYPDHETISSGSYPFTTAYYAVIRKDSAQDSSERKIIEWILSQDGQSLMEESGYVKIKK